MALLRYRTLALADTTIALSFGSLALHDLSAAASPALHAGCAAIAAVLAVLCSRWSRQERA